MPPAELSVTSLTWESVELTWTAGHDGGRRQLFVVTVTTTAVQSPDTQHNSPVELTTNSSTYNVTGMPHAVASVILFISQRAFWDCCCDSLH